MFLAQNGENKGIEFADITWEPVARRRSNLTFGDLVPVDENCLRSRPKIGYFLRSLFSLLFIVGLFFLSSHSQGYLDFSLQEVFTLSNIFSLMVWVLLLLIPLNFTMHLFSYVSIDKSSKKITIKRCTLLLWHVIEIDFADVEAIQLMRVKGIDNDGVDYCRYDLNIFHKFNKRTFLIENENKAMFMRDAKKIAVLLELEFLSNFSE